MTFEQELEAAAMQEYDDNAGGCVTVSFRSGANWAIRYSSLVKELVEALDHYSKLQDWDMLPVPALDALAKYREQVGE
jgi:hypothetical protein